jgi:hypothetical protein
MIVALTFSGALYLVYLYHHKVCGGIVKNTLKTLIKSLLLIACGSFNLGAYITCGQGGTFFIQNNATLNLSGADLTDATIKVAPEGTLDGVIDGYNTTLITQSVDGDKVVTFNGNLSIDSSVLSLNACTMVLTEDTELNGATWAFNDNATLDGGGNVFDLSTGTITIASGKVLKMRNIILKHLRSDSFGSSEGLIDFNKVTLVLNENIDWSAKPTYFEVNGPVLVVTGQYSLTVNTLKATINDATLSYDTLSDIDAHNIIGFGGNGRTLFVGGLATFTETTITSENPNLLQNIYLYEDNGDVDGHILRFSGGDDFTYTGNKRTIFFPRSSGSVLFVDNAMNIGMEHINLNGLQPSHISCGTEADLHFNHGTIITLNSDWSLTTPMIFGSGCNQEMTLDLNHNTIDFVTTDGNTGAIQVNGPSSAHLHIKNGRLTNVSGSVLQSLDAGTIILENVELVLSGNFNWVAGSLWFSQNCSVSGVAGAQLINSSIAIDAYSLLTATTLHLSEGITYLHNNESTSNFVFLDATSRLELVGATFKRINTTTDDFLVLKSGTLVVDYNSLIDVGSKGVQLGDGIEANDFTVEFLPGAVLNVTGTGSGSLKYNNVVA